ncbi:MAG: DNA translocase FtsK, partial [Treponema sp.]|nr:DNA translocase FtsK [Treponema sp.]
MSTNPEPLLARNDFKPRLAALLGAGTCVFAGILLLLSIGASLFRWTFINHGPGDLFTGAYGMFALTVPLYLFWAAWILCDRAFKPGRIFLLSTVIIPFLTLAVGFSFVRDFEIRRGEFALLDTLGRSGFSLLIITAAILESLGILVLHSILFEKAAQTSVKTPGAEIPRLKAESPPDIPRTVIQNNVIQKSVQPVTVITPEYILPEWKPLKSTAAFHHLDRDRPEEAAEKTEIPVSGQDPAEPPADEAIPEKDQVVVLSPSVFSPYARVSGGEKPEYDEQALMDHGDWLEADPFSNEEPERAEEETEEKALEEIEEIADEAELTAETEIMPDIVTETETLTETNFPPETEEAEPLAEEVLAEAEPPAEMNFPPETEETGPVAVDIPRTAKKKVKRHRGPYSVPVEGILNQYPDGQYWIIDEETRRAARTLQETLSEFGIQADVTGIRKGPVITMFEILPAPGVKLSKIVNLQDNIALRLAASSVRIVAPIPGKHAVGIEVPNKKRSIVSFREIIEGELSHKRETRRTELPVVLGKGITGDAITVDLTQMPHLLIAGSTGSGKSVCVNSMILSILYQLAPSECRLIMIDPKIVELKLYNDIPHLLTPVITEPKKAFQALQYCIFEMERRYACLDSMGVRDIKSYNRRIRERNIAAEHMPYIVVIIDEFADLMATTGKELESTVARLAAMSRAVGIHLVLATQRPSIDVITGLIKANIPSRIAFMVASKMDSRIIIDMVGAEKLLGKGDMLYAGAVDPFPIRMQGAFISEEEVERVVDYVKSLGEPEYIDDEIFYDEDEEDAG